MKVNSKAGKVTKAGYLHIKFNSKLYFAHRLAWFYEYGKMPDVHLDHINHDRPDNRISNLREVDNATNSKNVSLMKNNKSSICGVNFYKADGTWVSYISVNRTRIHLGYFKDKNEAICARLHANRLYQFHANHGK